MDDDGTEYESTDDDYFGIDFNDCSNQEMRERLKKAIEFLEANEHRRVTFDR